MLLRIRSGTMLLLEKWDKFFQLIPSSKGHYKMIFRHMLWQCKYTKFREINFKILAWILVTPKIILMVCGDGNLAACPWCKHEGTLEHVLFNCSYVKHIRCKVISQNSSYLGKVKQSNWIYGVQSHELNTLFWVINFAIYKGMLCHVKGIYEDLDVLIELECTHYQEIFPFLKNLSWT